MKEMMRTHVLLPRPLVQAVDELVGQRKRSRFVEEAVEEKMVRERQFRALEAIKESGSLLNAEDYPYWSTPEKTSEWVRQIRREADESMMRKWGGRYGEPSA